MARWAPARTFKFVTFHIDLYNAIAVSQFIKHCSPDPTFREYFEAMMVFDGTEPLSFGTFELGHLEIHRFPKYI